jgi:tRNA uridine 5-carboxymethylaminomethyl modification enzyme
MFTSRAEFRLSLRADNADRRLTPMGIELGLVDARRRTAFEASETALRDARAMLESAVITTGEAARRGLAVNQDGRSRSAWVLLSNAETTLEMLTPIWPELLALQGSVRERIEIEAAYDVYLERQRRDQIRLRQGEEKRIPVTLDFNSLKGLSNELKHKLSQRRPATIAEAERIDGMTPAALAILLVALRKTDLAKAA